MDDAVSSPPMVSDRILARYRSMNYFELPDKIQKIYTSAVCIPLGPLAVPISRREDAVNTLKSLQVPEEPSAVLYDYTFSDEEPDTIPSSTFIPPQKVIDAMLADRLGQWTNGKASVWVWDCKNKCSYRYALWVLEWWNAMQELRSAEKAWNEALAFVEEVRAEYDGEQAAVLDKLKDIINKGGWNSSLFRTKVNFDYQTLALAPLLHRNRWANKTHIDCALITIRARFQDKQDRIWVVSSVFSDHLRLGHPRLWKKKIGTYRPSVYHTAAWLAEDPERAIGSIIFVDAAHWVAIRMTGRGHVTIIDSLHENLDTFPDWWMRKNGLLEDWKAFARLIDPNISFTQEFVTRGFQKDGSSCGPASLRGLRWFLDESTPMWEKQHASLGRAELVPDILQAKQMYGPSFDSHKDSLLAYPRTPYNLPPEPPTEDEPESDAEPEPIKTPVAPKLSLWSMLTGQASAAGSTFVPLSLNDTKEPVMKRKPKPDADNSSEGGEPTDDDKKRVKRSKAAQGNRMRKLDENERKAVYEAAKQRGEITSYDKTSFTCTCPKKQKGLILSIINLKTPYDIQDMKQHFANLCHKRIYELDDQGRAKIEENTGKVIRKGMKFGSLLVRPVARPAAVPESTNSLDGPCVGLRGRRYTPLLASHHEWGGTKEGARNFDILCADLFPYKKDKKKRLPKGDFNRKQTMTGWTTTELARYNAGAEQSSLWRVDWVTEAVKSVHCTRSGPSRYGNHVCAACYALTNISTFQRSLRKRRHEQAEMAELSITAQEKEKRRKLDSTRNSHLQGPLVVVRAYRDKPGVIAISNMLGQPNCDEAKVFDRLGKLAREGAFQEDETLIALLETLANYTERREAGGQAMKGMRYCEKAKNFWISIRGRGAQANNQFTTAKQILGGPSNRTIQREIAERAQGFSTIKGIDYVRLDQYLQELKDQGLQGAGLVLMGDATKHPDNKTRAAVSFTTAMAHDDVTGHIVGGLLPMQRAEVRVDDDVDRIYDDIEASGGAASQILAIMIGVPLDSISPKVIGLYPTNGKEKGLDVKAILDEVRKYVHSKGFRVLSYALDGGGAEKGAQRLTLSEQTSEYLEVTAPEFNVSFRTPMLDGVPLIMVQDVEHARKTFRNNLTSGARLMLLGKSLICYEYLLRMLGYEGSGIVQSDLMWQDKQDDGAALRLFNAQALASLIEDRKIKEGMEGLFTLLSIFGELFDAWLHRELPHDQRARMAWRALFFLRAWKQDIVHLSKEHPLFVKEKNSYLSDKALETMEWLATSLLLLIEAHAEYFPNIPLQPWNHSTRSLEHWFGNARRLLHSDFTMSELLEGCRTGDVRLQIFHLGDPKLIPKAMATRKVGYQFDSERVDPDGETWKQLRVFPSKEMRTKIIPQLAHHEACSYLHMLSMPEPSKELSDAEVRERHRQLITEVMGDSEGEEDDLSDSDSASDSSQSGDESSNSSDEDSRSESDATHTLKGKRNEQQISKAASKGRSIKNQAGNRAIKMAAEAVVRADKVRRIFEEDELCAEKDLEAIYVPRKYIFDARMEPPAENPMALGNLIVASSSVGHFGTNILDPLKALESRQSTDAKPRVHTHKSKKTATVSKGDKGGRASVRFVRSQVRMRREQGNEGETRKTRTRAKSNREIRWTDGYDGVKKAMGSPMDAYRVPGLEVRGITKKDPIRVGSLILARPSIPAKMKREPHTFYLAKVLGVFGRSGAKFGAHSWREEFTSTSELSTMDLMVYMPENASGKMFTHGERRLYYTHAEELQLVHHFDPADKYLSTVRVNDDVFYALEKNAQVAWRLLTTKSVGDAIQEGIKAARDASRAKNKKAIDKKKALAKKKKAQAAKAAGNGSKKKGKKKGDKSPVEVDEISADSGATTSSDDGDAQLVSEEEEESE